MNRETSIFLWAGYCLLPVMAFLLHWSRHRSALRKRGAMLCKVKPTAGRLLLAAAMAAAGLLVLWYSLQRLPRQPIYMGGLFLCLMGLIHAAALALPGALCANGFTHSGYGFTGWEDVEELRADRQGNIIILLKDRPTKYVLRTVHLGRMRYPAALDGLQVKIIQDG